MIHLIYDRATGAVVSHVEADGDPALLEHHASIVVDVVPLYDTVKVIDGVLCGQDTSELLASEKRRANKRVTAARDARLALGITTQHGRFQADQASRMNIKEAALNAALDPTWSVKWRTIENMMVTLDAGAIAQVDAAMTAFVSDIYAQSFAMKDAVAATTSLDAVLKFTPRFN